MINEIKRAVPLADISASLITTVLIVELMGKGYLPCWLAVLMLLIFAGFRGVARAKGGFKVSVYIPFMIIYYVILIFCVALKGGGQYLFPILIGAFGGGFEKVIAQIIKLAIERHISFYLAISSICVLGFLRVAGLERASKFIYHTLFAICAPIYIFITFLLKASGGNLRWTVMIGGSLMSLWFMVEGAIIMFFGLGSSFRW